MDIVIRKAEQNDSDQIFDLAIRFAVSFRPAKESFTTSFKRLIENESASLLVAVCEEQVIGYLLGFEHSTFYANGRVSWVEELMVNEDFRRKRIATELMNEFEVWSREKRSRLVGVATRRASVFYRAIGYEESATFFRKLL